MKFVFTTHLLLFLTKEPNMSNDNDNNNTNPVKLVFMKDGEPTDLYEFLDLMLSVPVLIDKVMEDGEIKFDDFVHGMEFIKKIGPGVLGFNNIDDDLLNIDQEEIDALSDLISDRLGGLFDALPPRDIVLKVATRILTIGRNIIELLEIFREIRQYYS